MNIPKQMPLLAQRFPDSPCTKSVQTTEDLSQEIFKKIDSSKSKLGSPIISYFIPTNERGSDYNYFLELKQATQEILCLKNAVLEKEEEIKKLKIKLGDVKTHMEQFSYVASHDLKEPLRMVTSYLGLLKNKFGSQLDDKANTYIDFAIDGGARLHTMFNGLLDLSQTGRMDECKRMIPFADIVEEVKINISKKIKDSQANINVLCEMPVLPLYEKSIIKLMENLLCNAVKFSKPGETPVVEITATERESCWRFCIADNGIGVAERSYKQIFAVFSKLHNNTEYQGNGIGLAICKKAVEHHGGNIWVKSEENKGSNFYFTLPK